MTQTFTLDFNNAVLSGQHAGSGETLIFLHAGVADQRMWQPQMKALESKYHVISYDRRGFGATKTDDLAFSSIADLKRVADEFGAETVHLCGCSQGGLVALDFTLEFPERVGSLVLIASAVRGAPSSGSQAADVETLMDELDEAEESGDLEHANACEARLWLDGPGQPELRVAGDLRDLFLDMNGIALRHSELAYEDKPDDAWSRLGEIKHRALVLWADLDFDFMKARSRHLVETLPGATGHELTGAAHMVSMEQSAEVNALLVQFLGGS